MQAALGRMMIVLGLVACSDAGLPAARPAEGRMVDTAPTDGTQSETSVEGDPSEGCTYLGQHFADGVTFPANDGCNTCVCFGGLTACSLAACSGPAACDSPFDPGACDEAHALYAHDPQTGVCGPVSYSGCGGNLNRFESYTECAALCSISAGPGKSCRRDGQTFAHGERVARQPNEMTGCGPCLCNDGEVLCPPPDCACPAGQRLGLQCVGCDGRGGCSDIEEACRAACASDDDCDVAHGEFCDEAQGVCGYTLDCR